MDTKIVLIDGNSLFYREFFAMPLSMRNALGQPTNAVYGFATILIKVIETLKPTHIAVAFDVSKKTFRNEIFSDYKAGRKPMPEDLRSQIAPLKKMLQSMNICFLEKEGLEGDDILGTLSSRFKGEEILIVTGDRDCFQLVSKTTKVFLMRKGLSDVKIVDERFLLDEFKLLPSQMVELKALAGDSSDNIPGAKGIGDKTALNLVQKFGSIKNIYKSIDEIQGKLRENLIESRDIVDISLRLAKIDTQVDIECTLRDMEFDFPFGEKTLEFFKENGFRSLLKREELFEMQGREKKTTHAKVEEIDSLVLLRQFLKSTKTELSIFPRGDVIFLSNGNGEFVCDVSQSLVGGKFSKAQFWNEFSSVLSNPKIVKISFDCKSLFHMIADDSSVLVENYFDISIAKYLVDGNVVKDVSDVFVALDLDESAPASSLISARKVLMEKIEELGMHRLFYDIELPLAHVLFEMERVGFRVDIQKMDELGEKYTEELEDLTRQIHFLAGHEFNIKSPKQLGEVLFDELRLAASKKKSTNIDALEYIEDRHPIVPLVMRYRKVAKILSTYIDGLRPHIDEKGFVHTNFKQTITTTGRLSSTEPNLQNIPIRTDESREIRSMFVASSPQHVLIDADYSQIELRLLAHLSGDESLIEAYRNNEDIHTKTASNIFGVEPKSVTSLMRRTAKIVNFGVIYGISDFGLSSDLKITLVNAKNYIENYFKMHPKVDEYMKAQVAFAREKGFVSSMFGRMRKMMDINSPNYIIRSRAERASQNMPLQGSAADIIKVAMVNISAHLKKIDSKARLIMQVHDELIVDCPETESEVVREIVDLEMESAIKLSLPLVADTQVSYRWSEGH